VWFYVFDLKGKYYILPEVIAHGYVQREYMNFAVESRGNIAKIVYLIVLARPRPEYNFDEQVGCYPVVEYRQAINRSVNRPAGTWEMRPVSMDAPMYLQMFQELIAPDIINKMNWVGSRPRNIRWQDDNASPHVK
jgi:hypothetical protein